MVKTLIATVVLSLCMMPVSAEQPSANEFAGEWTDVPTSFSPLGDLESFNDEFQISDPFAYEIEAMKKGFNVTEESVGDPYSFGRDKTYLGMAVTSFVNIQEDCTTYPPTPPNVCIESNPAPAITNVDEPDLATIELPGRSSRSLLCFTFTPFASWEWANTTGSQQTAQMFLRPLVRIESEVLNDPALIDPNTGLPFNGVLLDSTISTFLQMRTLDPNETDFQFRATTRSCTGGLVSGRSLRSLGFSKKLIRKFFRNSITISFGVRGRVSMVTDATYAVGVRLYGD
ncbi:MAG: hypothetical protein GY906_09705 [bacterium]|nr:hypothetical protein [bacterium]